MGQCRTDVRLWLRCHCHFIVLRSIYSYAHHTTRSSSLKDVEDRFQINQAAIETQYRYLYTEQIETPKSITKIYEDILELRNELFCEALQVKAFAY